MSAPSTTDENNSTRFRGNYSFINTHSHNMAEKHRKAVAWHVVHKYEPFKKQKKTRGLNQHVAQFGTKEGTQRVSPFRLLLAWTADSWRWEVTSQQSSHGTKAG